MKETRSNSKQGKGNCSPPSTSFPFPSLPSSGTAKISDPTPQMTLSPEKKPLDSRNKLQQGERVMEQESMNDEI